MGQYLERYLQGECEPVWNELCLSREKGLIPAFGEHSLLRKRHAQ
jgi:hypothetical protein